MSRRFIGAVLAATLTITSFAAAPARAGSNEDIAKILGGIIVAATIAAALDGKKDRKDKVIHHHRPRVDGHGHGRDWRGRDRHRDRGWKGPGGRKHRAALPRQCRRSVETRNGTRSVFGTHCMNRTYSQVNRLPEGCKLKFRANNKRRTGYSAQCLFNHGYRVARN